MVLPLLALLAAASPGVSAAEHRVPEVSVGPAVSRSPAARARAAAPDLALVAGRLPASARHDLGPLTASERALLEGRSEGGRREKAHVVGVIRRPTESGGYVERAAGRTSWTAAFASTGAAGIRLRVEASGLPEGSRAYVYAPGGAQVHGPYTASRLGRAGGFWTNTVFADEVFLEVQTSGDLPDSARVRVTGLAHVDARGALPGRAAAGSGAVAEACPLDLRCVAVSDFPRLEEASRAVAMISYEDGVFLVQCTASLLNTTAGPIAPYLLTANHCVSTPAAAASVEAFWRYETPACGAPAPNPDTFPRSLGATLLATESDNGGSDFTLMQMDEDPPDGSVYLGWTTRDLAEGTALHRISHPEGLPQSYSHNVIAAFLSECTDLDRDQDWPSIIDRGMTLEGSSGASLLTDDLEVVGQLWGGCGLCGTPIPQTRDNDGAMRESYATLEAYLNPVVPGPCVPGPTTLCLNGGRFRVNVAWSTDSGSGAGQAESLTGDSGYFWFFNPANIELIVKVLNGCSIAGNHFWVFAGGLTNVGVLLTVTDTQTGAQKTYTNPRGTAFVPIQDTSAFACP